jgi:predicted RNase H-like HicB family nuclease
MGRLCGSCTGPARRHTAGGGLEHAERKAKGRLTVYLESLRENGESIREERQAFQGQVGVPTPFPA